MMCRLCSGERCGSGFSLEALNVGATKGEGGEMLTANDLRSAVFH